MFYTFLKEEEKFYLSKLEAEEKQILQILEEDEAGLLKQNQDIQGLILELQKRCQGSAQDLLQVRVCTWKEERSVKNSLEKKKSVLWAHQ